jgi:tetratricopeptide (TPR) repeat protein
MESRSRWPAVLVFALGVPLAAWLFSILWDGPNFGSRSQRPAGFAALVYGWFLSVGLGLRVYSRRKFSTALITWWVFMVTTPLVAILWAIGLDSRAHDKAISVGFFAVLGVLFGVASLRFETSTPRRLGRSSFTSRRFYVQDRKQDPDLGLRRAVRELEAAPERFLELAPRIAQLYAQTGRPDEAVDLVDEVVARQPTAESYRVRANVMATLDRKRDALVDLGRAIKLTEGGRPLHNLLLRRADLAMETPDLDLALSDINRCIREFGESSIHYSIRALIHQAKHNPVAANLDSQKAREMDMRERR